MTSTGAQVVLSLSRRSYFNYIISVLSLLAKLFIGVSLICNRSRRQQIYCRREEEADNVALVLVNSFEVLDFKKSINLVIGYRNDKLNS